MPRTARPLACAESTDALRREYLREPDPRLRRRLLVAWTYRTEGESPVRVAALTGVPLRTVARWLELYREGGLEGLLSRGARRG